MHRIAGTRLLNTMAETVFSDSFFCNSCCPSTAGCQLYIEFVFGSDDAYFFFIVGSFTVGIDAVGKDFGFVVAFAEEGEVDGAATRSPVGHAAYKPSVSFAADRKSTRLNSSH